MIRMEPIARMQTITIYDFLEVKYVKRKYGFSHRRKYESHIDQDSHELLNEIYSGRNHELKENTGIDYGSIKIKS